VLNILKHVIKTYLVCNYEITLQSKSSKQVESFVSYLLHVGYHNHYINWGFFLFAHFTQFINMTMEMYIILFQGWKSDVHDVPNTYVKSSLP